MLNFPSVALFTIFKNIFTILDTVEIDRYAILYKTLNKYTKKNHEFFLNI